jgi:cytochrome P450
MADATSYSACAAMQRDPAVFSARGIEPGFTGSVGGPTMLSQDDPEHAGARAPINPVLRSRSIDAWGPVFERNARTYADRMEDVRPDHADLNRDYAAPLAGEEPR